MILSHVLHPEFTTAKKVGRLVIYDFKPRPTDVDWMRLETSNPASIWESAFKFFNLAKALNINNQRDQINFFLENPPSLDDIDNRQKSLFVFASKSHVLRLRLRLEGF